MGAFEFTDDLYRGAAFVGVPMAFGNKRIRNIGRADSDLFLFCNCCSTGVGRAYGLSS